MRWPRLLASTAPLFLTAQSAPAPFPNVVEAGRIAATLSDVQTILYFQMVVIVCLLVERWLSGWQARATANKFADAANKLSDAMKADGTQMMVQLALIQQELSNIKAKLPG